MLSDFSRRILIVFFLVVLIDLSAQSQPERKSAKFSLKGNRQGSVGQSGILEFSELEARAYYRDERKLSKISDHYNREEFEQAYHLLRSYVSKFAI
ncbi:MAG: hypothetical protein ACKO3B_07685, partial [Bacteroidota bacterium]